MEAAQRISEIPREGRRARDVDMDAGSGIDAALRKAAEHLASLQRPDGSWEGEMVWCTMILSQYIIVQRIIGGADAPALRDPRARAGMIRHFEVTRTAEGTWGLHGESGGYVFTTALAYVALRLLGLGKDHPLCAPALRFLRDQPGGVLSVPTWGKLWLALCDLYGWEGVNPFPPEIFLLPEWLPVHPNHYYCHTRYIYLGIAYLYGRRFRGRLGPLTAALREELYPGVAYEQIDFAAHRHDIAATDLFVRPSAGLRAAYDALMAYERQPVKPMRQRALDHCLERILYEQRASRYQGLSPVNGLLNCLALYAYSPHHLDLGPSLAGLESWRWEDEAEGVRFAGAHSTTWDTAFSLLALLAAPPAVVSAHEETIRRGYRFLRGAQLRGELPHRDKERRDPALGGFCFSDGQHRWPVSDCTAEALCAILEAHEVPGLIPEDERIEPEWLVAAARFIASRQNRDGGFGTYERRRGSVLLEWINPSEMYGSCMTERSYIECTSSCVAALGCFLRSGAAAGLPGAEVRALRQAVERGVRLLRRRQLPDGSYLGFWGINFTYAIFHVVKGLLGAGVSPRDEVITRALSWLRQKQRADGGWGEHYRSCLEERYMEHARSQVVMTSWALLALLHGGHEAVNADAVQRGLAFLRGAQETDGSFPQGAQNGVFFGTAMLDYRLYKSYFPAWALASAASSR
jgi:lanosterol synthase